MFNFHMCEMVQIVKPQQKLEQPSYLHEKLPCMPHRKLVWPGFVGNAEIPNQDFRLPIFKFGFGSVELSTISCL